MPQAKWPRILLIGCGCTLEAWALLALLHAPGADIPRHVAATLAAWVVYIVALWLIVAKRTDRPRNDLVLIFVVAAALRLTLVLSPPSLSDDIYRAVWDARLVHHGVNPYEYPPAAPELMPYRDDAIWERVNHKEQRTPYPPLATMLGVAAYTLLPEQLLAMQVLAALLDLGAAAALAWFLSRVGSDPRRAIVLAWSPIGAIHFAHSGHNDAAMVLAVLVGALLLTCQPRWPALLALGVATSVKGMPALMLPAWARAGGAWPGILLWAATCAALALPFLSAGAGLAAGVIAEAGDQSFNDSIHLLLERALRLVSVPHPGSVAAVLGLAATAGVALLAGLWHSTTVESTVTRGFRVLAVYLLLAAVVEPWYFTWLAPLIALRLMPAANGIGFHLNDTPAWLWLMGAATLTELTYLEGGSVWWVPIRLTEYGPAYALLALALVNAWRRFRHAEAGRV